jgi:prolyl-tRNA synthetase
MRQSQLFTKTSKTAPRGETSKNAQLLEQGGFIYKNLAGVYSYLPLGFRVLEKIIKIIREEMNAIGGVELVLNTLQNPEVWKKTNRWSDQAIDTWFRTNLKTGAELGLATTHEEPLTEIMQHYVSSYKDLPVYVYQFQTKFRNELRAKSGLMRVREFIMKDLYSFCRNQRELDEFYEVCAKAYLKIFRRVGLGDCTYRTYASGKPFSKFSDEFQTVSPAGEDTIYLDLEKKVAVNKEVLKAEVLKELGLRRKNLVMRKAIEVGNIFKLGTRYSEPLGLYYTDEQGRKHPVVMGSYGIGPGRLMGTIVEVLSDERGIVWPETVAPFQVHLLELGVNASKIYKTLRKAGIEVLYDDRDVSAGEKFADADLIGIPYRVVVSEKTMKQGKVEVKKRSESKVALLKIEAFISKIKDKK